MPMSRSTRRSSPDRGLGRPGHQLVALPDDLLPDDEHASCEVDVPPAEADSLTSPQARQSHDLEQRPEVVPAGLVEEPAELLRLEGLDPRPSNRLELDTKGGGCTAAACGARRC